MLYIQIITDNKFRNSFCILYRTNNTIVIQTSVNHIRNTRINLKQTKQFTSFEYVGYIYNLFVIICYFATFNETKDATKSFI